MKFTQRTQRSAEFAERTFKPRHYHFVRLLAAEEFVCYIGRLKMKTFSRTLSSRLVSAALLAVVIGALCFSVGEGLRLTPFPVSDLTQTQQEKAFTAKTSNEIGLSQYGPLNIPAQTQKRGKRQIVEFAVTASPGTRANVSSFFSACADEVVNIASVLSVARPAGRAPPVLS